MKTLVRTHYLQALIDKEEQRQLNGLELIASENFVSPAVRSICGSVLTHKYAEGYPGKRYYGGCEVVDEIESYVIEQFQSLFSAEYVNVQPHSGSTANFAVFFACLSPGDTILGMNLAHGGHLTHGSPVSISGKWFHAVSYDVHRDTQLINFDDVRSKAKKHRPKIIIAGASSYARAIDFAHFRAIADECDALLMVDMAHIAGIVAAGLHDSPIPHAHIVTSTTHKTLRGPRGGLILMGTDFPNPYGVVAAKSGRTKKMSELVDSSIIPGIQGGPLLHIIAAKGQCAKEAHTLSFKQYQKQVCANARALAEACQNKGMHIVTGGTDNHIVLVDLQNMGVSGKDAEIILGEVGITVNKNMIPYDTRGPLTTSGIRLGTPALTSRGMKEGDMHTVANFIWEALQGDGQEKISQKVQEFASGFPLFFDLGEEENAT